jgi:hypothetical protein
VLVVTYGCYPETDTEPVLSHEHEEIGMFTEDEVDGLTTPAGYRRSITTWFARLRTDAAEPAG